MRVSEVIKILSDLKETNGDLEVKNFWNVYDIMNIEIRYLKIPKDKRNSKFTYWSKYDAPELKGDKVISI